MENPPSICQEARAGPGQDWSDDLSPCSSPAWPAPQPPCPGPRRFDEKLVEAEEKRPRAQCPFTSYPEIWFLLQVDEALNAIWKLPIQEVHRLMDLLSDSGDLEQQAAADTRARWKAEGIWDKSWDARGRPRGPWPHHKPSEEGRDDPHASRPFPQFLNEMRRQWVRLQGLGRISSQDEGFAEAYDAARQLWGHRGLRWPWGTWPGAQWPHEMDADKACAPQPPIPASGAQPEAETKAATTGKRKRSESSEAEAAHHQKPAKRHAIGRH